MITKNDPDTDAEPTDDNEKETPGTLNAPKLDKDGKPTNKAVETAKQAHGICKGLKRGATEKSGRLDLCGTIASLYNGQAPFDQAGIDRRGEDWRSNFSTGFLPSIVDRVTPQMRDPIFRADILTHSTLPSEVPKSSEKSRKFCEKTTKLIRAWRGWNDFVSLLTQDVCLYGQGTPGAIDSDWRPRIFRPDQCYLFEGSDQHASKLPCVMFYQPMLMHEFLDIMRDRKAMETAGYDFDECIKAVNHGAGQKQGDSADPTPLEQQDAVREKGVLQYSAENQARTVNLFHLFVQEYDGTIALWTVSEEGGYGVRHIEDCEKELDSASIEDIVALFTLQVGNGKFYGSKGLGRLLANIHIATERLRCLAFDQQYLAGLVILQTKAGDIKNLQPVVMHPFIIVQGSATFSKETIAFNATDWKMLDDMLVSLAESIAGAFLPPNLNTAGAANTKIEAAQKAEREIALRQGVLGRFFAQFADLIGMMQRRIYSKTNIKEAVRIWKDKKEKEKKGIIAIAARIFKKIKAILGKDLDETYKTEMKESKLADQEAVTCIVELLDSGLSVEDIVMLSEAPTGNDLQSNNAERDQKTVDFIGTQWQNPYLNKRKMTELATSIAIGEDRMKLILNEQSVDPDDVARESRQQIIEFSEMIDGNDMPVAPSENHNLHRQALAPKLGQLMGILEKTMKAKMPITPAILKATGLGVKHYSTHLQLDKDSPPEQVAKEAQAMEIWNGMLDQAEKYLEQQEKNIAKAMETMAKNGQGGAAGGPGAGAGGPPADPAAMVEGAVNIRSQMAQEEAQRKQAEIDAQKLQLDRDKHEHTVAMDTISMAQENARLASEANMEAVRAGMQDASSEQAAVTKATTKAATK